MYLVSAGYPDTYVPGISRQTKVPPVDAHIWRQLHVSAVARCSDSYCCILIWFLWTKLAIWLLILTFTKNRSRVFYVLSLWKILSFMKDIGRWLPWMSNPFSANNLCNATNCQTSWPQQSWSPGVREQIECYELVPATDRASRLRNFALCFFRVGKRNLAGLCVTTIRHTSRLDLVWINIFFRSLGIRSHFGWFFR